MAVAYTTAQRVVDFLRLKDTDDTRIDIETYAGEDIKKTDIEQSIEWAEEEIDRKTRHSWMSRSVTDEIHNFKYMRYGVHGYPFLFLGMQEKVVALNHRKIRAFVQDTDYLYVWVGEWIDYIATKTEGRADDFWVDYERGLIYFVSSYPTRYLNAVKVTYRYGDASVPKDIEKAATLLAAIDLVSNEGYSFIVPDGGDGLTLDQKLAIWERRYEKVISSRIELVMLI